MAVLASVWDVRASLRAGCLPQGVHPIYRLKQFSSVSVASVISVVKIPTEICYVPQIVKDWGVDISLSFSI